jgi:hypothetical protein
LLIEKPLQAQLERNLSIIAKLGITQVSQAKEVLCLVGTREAMFTNFGRTSPPTSGH